MDKRPFDAKPYSSNTQDSLKKINSDELPVAPEISSVKPLPICETPLVIEWWMEWNAAGSCPLNCADPSHNH
jgi:hypothetical protein